MKKLIITTLAVLSIAAAPTPSFTFLRYSDNNTSNESGKIIGVTLNAGVREIVNPDGTKSYYIAGKYLKEVVEAYNQ